MASSAPLVLYHADCPDGMTAAWAAKRYRPSAELRPIKYHDEVPAEAENRDVQMVDFCFDSVPKMEELLRLSRSLLVIDHHKSANKVLCDLVSRQSAAVVHNQFKLVYDQAHSGAYLAWTQFFPGSTTPSLVQYVEDRDLWTWKLKQSREVNAFINSFEMTYESYDALSKQLAGEAMHDGQLPVNSSIFATGSSLLRMQAKLVGDMVERAMLVKFAGYLVLCAPAPVLRSEVCGELAANMPFALTYRDFHDGTRAYDLRCREWFGQELLGMDQLAMQHGGGGHPAAAGFQVPYGKDQPIFPAHLNVQSNWDHLPLSRKLSKSPFELVRDATKLTHEIIKASTPVSEFLNVPTLDSTVRALVKQNLKGIKGI